MTDRFPIGYVVEIDGSQLILNLLEEARGHVAGHRDGLSTVEQPGDLIGVEAGAETIVVRIQSVAFAEPKEVHTGRVSLRAGITEPLRQLKGRVIGFLSRSDRKLSFQPQDWRLPVLGASAFPLSDDETAAIIGGTGDPITQVCLGTDTRNRSIQVKVSINDLLGRHMAVLGATGQGKTHYVAAVLQQLISFSSSARIIIFDVNGEYGPAFTPLGRKMKRTVLGAANEVERAAGVNSLQIPYYSLGRHGLARLLIPSERTQMPALRFAVEHLRYIEADAEGAHAVGQDRNCMFDDCRSGSETEAYHQLGTIRTKTSPMAQAWPHMRGLSCLAAESYSLKMSAARGTLTPQRDAFSYGHIHSLINRCRSLIDDARFRQVVNIQGGQGRSNPLSMVKEVELLVADIFGGKEYADTDWDVHIIDLSKLTQDLMPFVLGSLLEMYAAELFRRGPGKTHPTMLVLEEAHHYLRQLPSDADVGQHSLAYERLAKEGRKFGLSLMISTQRPSEVSPTVLAQCGTWSVFRLSNETDQKAVGAAAEAAGVNVTRQLAGLGRGESIVFGAALPVPTRISVIRPDPQPDSKDPPFVEKWGFTAARV